jgi:tetratricopeptide (TPR) repeat protein
MRARRAAALLLVACTLAASPAWARPSVWAAARDPSAQAEAHALAEASRALSKYERARYGRGELSPVMAPVYLAAALRILFDGGAEHAADVRLRYALAYALEQAGQSLPAIDAGATTVDRERVVRLLRAVVDAPDAASSLRADAYNDLAIAYARLGRHADEVAAYDRALELQPRAESRSVLLANRAEALMGLGDITAAVAGYRAALALVSTGSALDMMAYGVTTLWGLAVALDRAGEIDQALDAIRLARAYDPGDVRLNSSSWFYGVPSDEAWYAALGAWSAARQVDVDGIKLERYDRATRAWQEYLARAPAASAWLAIAKARLAQCEKERDVLVDRLRARGRRPAAMPPQGRPPRR